jgi:hypothetical protein
VFLERLSKPLARRTASRVLTHFFNVEMIEIAAV